MYQIGEKVFAKVKGHPFWPARINKLPDFIKIPKGKFPIFFYGTHEVYFVSGKDIKPYVANKDKYGQPNRKKGFNEGMEEIENNPGILEFGTDPESMSFLRQFYPLDDDDSPGNVDESTTISHPSLDSQDQSVSSLKGKEKISLNRTESKRTNSRKSSSGSALKEEVTVDCPLKSTNAMLATSTTPDTEEKPMEITSCRPSRMCTRRLTSSRITTATVSVSDNSILHKEEKIMQLSCDDVAMHTVSSPPLNATTSTSSSHISSTTDSSRLRLRESNVSDDTHLPIKKRRICSGTSEEPPSSLKSPNSPNSISLHLITSAFPCNSSSSHSQLPEDNTTNTTTGSGNCLVVTEKAPLVVTKEAADSSHPSPPLLVTSEPAGNNSIQQHHPEHGNECDSSVPLKSTESQDCVGGKVKKPKRPSSVAKHAEKSTPEDDRSMEVRLKLTNRDIKATLVKGQENYPACIELLENLSKKPLKVSILSRTELIDTVKKCRKYRFSSQVKVAAQKAYAYFLELFAKADREELNLVELESKRQMQLAREATATSVVKIPSPASSLVELTTPVTTTSCIVGATTTSTTASSNASRHSSVLIHQPPVRLETSPIVRKAESKIVAPSTTTAQASAVAPSLTASVLPDHQSKQSLRKLLHVLCEARCKTDLREMHYFIVDRYDAPSMLLHTTEPPHRSSQQLTEPPAQLGESSLDERIAQLMAGRDKRLAQHTHFPKDRWTNE